MFAAIGFTGFLIDRVLKYLVLSMEASQIRLLGDWARFSLYMNDQMALSIPVSVEVTRLIALVVFLTIGYLAIRTARTSPRECGAFLLVLFGAFSNLIDRFLYGYVVDYLDFFGKSMLNLGDVFISVGLLLVVAYQMGWRREKPSNKTSSK